MKSNQEQSDDRYQLLLLEEQHIPTIYQWNMEEKHLEHYTCRPVHQIETLEEYTAKTLTAISESRKVIYVLVKADDFDKPLGRIVLFDINVRNHSAEFGYYLPEYNRGTGLGTIMVQKFLQISYCDETLNLNKIYATTSSNNQLSIKLLEKHGFKLDGRLREHYWIEETRYDQLIYSMLRNEWMEKLC